MRCATSEEPHLDSEKYTYVNIPVIDIQKTIDPMSEVVSQAIYGNELRILSEHNDYIEVTTHDTTVGWVRKKTLIQRTIPYPNKEQLIHIKPIWAHLYHTQDVSSHPPYITLPFSVKLERTLYTERWSQISLLDGKKFWMHTQSTAFHPQPLSLDEMIALSYQFIGLPYRWGGTSSFGYDCSGFTQMLFLQMGISLPRDAYMQARMGTIVTNTRLAPGDLLFFTSTGEKITHTGLYIGKNHFIHTVASHTTPKIVQISNIEDSHWKRNFVQANRIVSI